MAVNKNFVVKNGLEVNTNLIVADATNNKVGIASTAPRFELDVAGGIGATDVYVSGVSTAQERFDVGTGGNVLSVIAASGGISTSKVGIGTTNPEFLLDVRSPVSTGHTAMYVFGDMRVSGDINLDDITLDQIDATSLNITGISTFVGFTTFKSDVFIAGIVTAATASIGGSVTATNFFGDGSNLTGFPAGAVGVSSEGTLIGVGATLINFASTNGTAFSVSAPSSGVSTVTVTPGVSVGLAIALGG